SDPEDRGILGAAVSRNSHTVKGQARGELALRKRGGLELPIDHSKRLDAILISPKINDGAPGPFPIRHVENAETNRLKALHNLTVAGLHVPHIHAIQHIKHSLLTAPD